MILSFNKDCRRTAIQSMSFRSQQVTEGPSHGLERALGCIGGACWGEEQTGGRCQSEKEATVLAVAGVGVLSLVCSVCDRARERKGMIVALFLWSL